MISTFEAKVSPKEFIRSRYYRLSGGQCHVEVGDYDYDKEVFTFTVDVEENRLKLLQILDSQNWEVDFEGITTNYLRELYESNDSWEGYSAAPKWVGQH